MISFFHPTNIFPSGYFIEVFFVFNNPIARVAGPTLPVNIVNEIISFDAVERSDVIPRDIPTVPNADTVSNKISKNLNLSVSIIVIVRATIITTPSDTITTVRALITVCLDMVLLNTTVSFSPFKVKYVEKIKIANVVVLSPPAVDAGLPPINMRIIYKKAVASWTFPMSTE